MRSLTEIRSILAKHKLEIIERFKVRSIGIFGSYARGEQAEESDVDIIVEFEEGYKTFDNYVELKFHLEKLLGISVDLVSKTALKPKIAPYILKETIYV